MRHRSGYRKLNKATDQRLAMFRSMARALFEHGRVKVTCARAKEVRRMVEKVITLAKAGDLSSRRKAISMLVKPDIVKKVFDEAKTRFAEKGSGFTRITKIGNRVGDAAPVALLELI